MTESFTVLLQLVAGISLGAIFYGGLWWTICARPGRLRAVWFVGSFLLRALFVLVGFYGAARGGWRGLLACIAGFLVGRVVVTRFTGVKPDKRIPVVPGASS